MCIRMPIPPAITVPFDPDAVQEHPFDMDYESDAETIPWDFNSDDPIPWVDTLAEHDANLAMDARIAANGGSLFDCGFVISGNIKAARCGAADGRTICSLINTAK